MDDLISRLEQWHRDSEHQRIIDCLEALSATQNLDYTLTCCLARAYNNLADPRKKGYREQLERAEGLLRSVAGEGESDPLWHYRLGYSLFYLDREEEALSCFRRAHELDPEDQDVIYFIRECDRYIAAKISPGSYNGDTGKSAAEKESGALERDRQKNFSGKEGGKGEDREKNTIAKEPLAPEMYEQEEWDAVEAHLEKYFGHCANVFHELMSPDIHVDIYIMDPTPERNYYVLSTFGMGAHRMNVPEELAEKKLERAEIIVTLPPDWKVQDSDEQWYWPIRWLKILARLPIEEDSWLGWGHTVSNPDDAPFAGNTKLCGVMLVQPEAFDREAVCCRLPNGDEVNFYQMIPLTFEEMQFKLHHSAEELLERFTARQLEVVDAGRASVCPEEPEKRFAIPREELKALYEGEGPQGCIATDRIVVDGQPVGFCWREEPEPGDKDWDSGWRFTAGDESRSYLDDPGRSGVYALNTICNYDPDIIPLLDSEPGTAWSRGEDGVFRPERYEED